MQIISHIIMIDGEARIERKPHLKAEMVARMFINGDYSIEEVMQHYDLTPSEVHAALAYYYDNRPALDAAYGAALEQIEQSALTLETFKARVSRKP